jgi:uncharacterized protein (DUF427 family)
MESNPAPGWSEHPEYRVDLVRDGRHARATVAGEIVAESDDVITVKETGHNAVYYFPRQNVRMDLLQRTDRHSHCPFKGEASYFSVGAAKAKADNAAWSYEQPYDEVHPLKDRIAFYADKVTVTIG